MKKEEKVILGKLGLFWASLGKFGQVRTSQDKENGKEEAERIRKGNKYFSGQGGEEEGGGGETKVQNSPKAFGELISLTDTDGNDKVLGGYSIRKKFNFLGKQFALFYEFFFVKSD